MPLKAGSQKTLWIFNGVFLFLCFLMITATEEALPFLLCLPGLYSIMSYRQTSRTIALALALAPSLLIFVPGLMVGAVLYLCLIGCGIVLHKLIDKGWIGLAVFIPACMIFGLCVLGISFAAYQKGLTSQAMIAEWVRDLMDQVASVYTKTLSPKVLDEFRLTRPVMESRFVQLFWGISGSFILSIMWLNLLIASRVRAVKVRTWKSPDWMVVFFILASALVLVQHDLMHTIGLNLLIVVSQIYFFQGLAIVATAAVELNWSRLIRWVIYLLILSQIYIMIGVAALGLFDTWFNFREMIRNKKGDVT
ncbi:MAG TPA: DUF2232 domain-containing protein [Deltaproteobacteria bacterium]|jgi:hypothetical protein|nr:DUF2232 domain-containing protein [Deltaproteobacteria bacterium]HQJ08406.1 DUF2232 domain-containing protein [Deltaproteobacteria bacterium]